MVAQDGRRAGDLLQHCVRVDDVLEVRATRQQIVTDHRNYEQGYIYFLATVTPHPSVGPLVREVDAIPIAKELDRQLQAAMPAGAARNALDCALLDLEAKRAGKRVWTLLGRPAPRPCTTAFTISLGTPEAMAAATAKAAHRPLLKIKLGGDGDGGGDSAQPLRPDGYLRPEWVAGGWSDDGTRAGRWAGVALTAAELQGAKLCSNAHARQCASAASGPPCRRWHPWKYSFIGFITHSTANPASVVTSPMQSNAASGMFLNDAWMKRRI